jgi:hypothetical protein
VIYNVQKIEPVNCSTVADNLTLSIKNKGNIGISNLQIQTNEGFVDLGGIEPGQTTCPYPIQSIYSNPSYKLYVLKTNGRSAHIEANSIDHIGDEFFTDGQLQLIIELKQEKKSFSVEQFEVSKQ